MSKNFLNKKVFVIMKIGALQLFLAIIGASYSYSHTSNAQDLMKAKITLQLQEASLKTILSQIEKQTGVVFSYQKDVISIGEKMEVNFQGESVEQVLNKLLTPRAISFQLLQKKHIVLTKDFDKDERRADDPGQKIRTEETPIAIIDRTITGKVTDEKGDGLPGVTVVMKGSQRGTVTNEHGTYSMSVPDKEVVTLVFSYVGYVGQEIALGNRTALDIKLIVDTQALQEVVVVGFGTQKKQSVVGAQSTVRPAELKAPVRDLTSALAGRLAGVVATERGGGPGGEGASLLIRGVGTFSSSPQSPLLVVDGVPDRAINNIDPEDVESFTVLKDATATAVYGTRGANGVILVNTKKGKAGKPSINLELNQAITRFTFLPEYLDAPTFMNLYNEGLTMRGRQPLYTQERIALHANGSDPDLYPNTDWFDALFNDFGTNNRATLNINGGSENATYYISAGYFGEVGQYKRDKVQAFNSSLKQDRFNFTSNVSVNITPSTKLDLGVNGFITNLNRPAYGVNDLFKLVADSAPHVIPPQYSNGQWPQLQGAVISPLMALNQSGVVNTYNNAVRSNLRVNQDFGMLVKGLSATGMFAFDVNSTNSVTRSRTLQTYYALSRDESNNLVTEISTAGTNALSFGLARYGDRRFYSEAALNYVRKFNKHDVSGMFLFNQSDYSDATARVGSYKAAIPYRQRNYVGRANYGYDDKYYAEANFSYSGSDNFVASERYGFFPSFGLGWVISKEKFFEKFTDAVPHLKLRYTYGLSGNAALNDPNLRFLYLTTVGASGGYTFGEPGSNLGFTGYNESRIGGNVRWETSYRQNLGFETNLLQSDLQLIVELFHERRAGILLPDNVIPYASGFTNANIPYNNIGKTKNKGIDLTLDYNKSWTNTTFASFRGTFTYNKNVAVYDGLPPWRHPYLNRIGQPISQRFGYVATGLFQSEEEIANAAVQSGDVRPGDIRYKDLNGDGIINANDQTGIGYGEIPRISYGMNFGFGYGGFDLSLFFQGTGLMDLTYTSGAGVTPFRRGATYGNMYTTILDRWTPDNPNPRPFYPRMSTREDQTTNYYNSTWWVQRADYIRLKQAELGYNFTDKALLKRMAIKKLRVYVNGSNLFTKSRWTLWDPELGGGQGVIYPNIATYNIGIRANFQ
jgi:TonB-linked SusC/RagA family outer membrane protein